MLLEVEIERVPISQTKFNHAASLDPMALADRGLQSVSSSSGHLQRKSSCSSFPSRSAVVARWVFWRPLAGTEGYLGTRGRRSSHELKGVGKLTGKNGYQLPIQWLSCLIALGWDEKNGFFHSSYGTSNNKAYCKGESSLCIQVYLLFLFWLLDVVIWDVSLKVSLIEWRVVRKTPLARIQWAIDAMHWILWQVKLVGRNKITGWEKGNPKTPSWSFQRISLSSVLPLLPPVSVLRVELMKAHALVKEGSWMRGFWMSMLTVIGRAGSVDLLQQTN